MWFGAMRVDDGRAADRQPDRVPAVPAADPVRGPDRRLHVHPRPARGGLGGPDPRGPRDRADRSTTRSSPVVPAPDGRRARRRRVPRRRVPLPGRRAAGPPRHLVPGRPGRDDRDRRQHRQRQVDAHQPDPALLRRDRRARSSSTASTSGEWTARTSGSGSASIPQKAFLFSGHRRAATSASATRTRPTRSCGGRSRSPRARDFVERDGGRPRGADHPGRHERVGRPAPAPGDRPGAREGRPAIFVFDDSFSRARLRDRRAAPGRARARARPTRRVIIVAQRVGTIMQRRPDHRAWTTARIVGIGTHRRAARDERDLPRDRLLAAVRGGGRGMTRATDGRQRRRRHRPATAARRRRPGARRARWPGGPAVPAAPLGGRRPRRPGHVRHGHGPAAARSRRTSAARSGGCSVTCGPERPLIALVILLAVVSVSFAVIGPKILGNAINVIFEGAISKQPAGRRDPGAGRRRRCGRQGQDQLADMLVVDAPDARRRASTSARSRSILGAAHRGLRHQRDLRLGAGATSWPASPSGPSSGCGPRSTRSSAGCRCATSTATRAATC